MAVAAGLRLSISDRGAEADVLVYVSIDISSVSPFVEISVDDDALLIEIAGRKVVFYLLPPPLTVRW